MNVFRSILKSRGWSKIKIKEALRAPEKKLNKRDQEEFVNLADERLYKAKEGGRNQFIYS